MAADPIVDYIIAYVWEAGFFFQEEQYQLYYMCKRNVE